MDEILKCVHLIERDRTLLWFCLVMPHHVTEQNFPVVLIIVRYKVLLTFDFEKEIINCNHSNAND